MFYDKITFSLSDVECVEFKTMKLFQKEKKKQKLFNFV